MTDGLYRYHQNPRLAHRVHRGPAADYRLRCTAAFRRAQHHSGYVLYPHHAGAGTVLEPTGGLRRIGQQAFVGMGAYTLFGIVILWVLMRAG